MSASLFLSLRDDTAVANGDEGQLSVRADGVGVTLKRLTPGVGEALRRLGNGGAYEEHLAEQVLQADGDAALSRFYYYLDQLGRRGLLLRSAMAERGPLATLVATSTSFRYPARGTAPDQFYVLSRFAYLRAEGGHVLLESPLAHAQVRLHDGRAAALVHALARPGPISEVAERVPGLCTDEVALVLDLLLNADMIGEADETGTAATDRPAALESWEFHDLLFHARSREGRHANPVGGTFRFAGRLAPPPPLKELHAGETVALDRPDLERLRRDDLPFAHVQETRRSIRDYAERPITLGQLGEFLYRVARVRECAEMEMATPHGPIRLGMASRPYPGGGALYELELYVAVKACQGLAAGLYHYEPVHHGLERLSGQTAEVERLLKDAAGASGIPGDRLQVLVIVAARFQRVMWKYAAMAYGLVLKNAGVLYQTMYLAATAMKLAPCGLGGGDADLFARAAGTDYYAETSVGEFLLGSLP
ncbi:MAG: SagB family peptide dehydrogenase [Planctomycetes bacterium]|nr:SagB family peptide dehydrogenase [Planctomycetota bacterium]